MSPVSTQRCCDSSTPNFHSKRRGGMEEFNHLFDHANLASPKVQSIKRFLSTSHRSPKPSSSQNQPTSPPLSHNEAANDKVVLNQIPPHTTAAHPVASHLYTKSASSSQLPSSQHTPFTKVKVIPKHLRTEMTSEKFDHMLFHGFKSTGDLDISQMHTIKLSLTPSKVRLDSRSSRANTRWFSR